MANKTGKGYFKKGHDERRNTSGAPPRGQSWQETIKRITNMTRDEAIEYVGPSTTLGKQLRELPPNVPIKDAMIFISIINYGRDPNARMFTALTDREDGKPNQPIEIKDELTDDERIARLTALLDAARARRDGQATE